MTDEQWEAVRAAAGIDPARWERMSVDEREQVRRQAAPPRNRMTEPGRNR